VSYCLFDNFDSITSVKKIHLPLDGASGGEYKFNGRKKDYLWELISCQCHTNLPFWLWSEPIFTGQYDDVPNEYWQEKLLRRIYDLHI